MPPKKAAKSGGKAVAKKKSEPKPEQLADIDFLNAVGGSCSQKELHKVLQLFSSSRGSKDKTFVLTAACEAIGRICSTTEGLMLFLEAEAVELIAKLAADAPEAGGKYTIVAVDGLCAGVVGWMDRLDPVDFAELSNLMYFALWLGGVDEDVAVATCFAIEKFALYQASHAAGMLQAGVLRVLHGLLAVHHGPEFVEQVFSLLYLLCDLPEEVVAEPLMEEPEIIGSVVELMSEAPLNMRLQLTGVRLLAAWQTRLRDHEEIPDLLSQANPSVLLEDAVQKLDAGGFPHYSSWLSTVGRRALCESAA